MPSMIDSSLVNITELFRALQRRVADLVGSALASLKDPCSGPGLDVDRLGEDVNRLTRELEVQIALTYARYQPVAKDHRFLLAVMATIAKLEHMSDCASEICRMASQIENRFHGLSPLVSLAQRGTDDSAAALDRLEETETAHFASLATGQREIQEAFDHVLRGLGKGDLSRREVELNMLVAVNLDQICEAAASILNEFALYRTGAGIAVGQLLEVVGGMPEPQLDQFMDGLTAFRASKRAPRLSHPESELLTRINEGVPVGLQRRYDALVAKRGNVTITEPEYAELLDLTEQVEKIDAKRVEYLAELARLRHIPLRALMRDLGIKTPSYA